MDSFLDLDQWLAGLLAQLNPAQMRQVNRRVAAELRRSQSQRIARQQNPDGSRYQPRKTPSRLRGKAGQVKRRAMFARLRTARHLKAWSSPDSVDVGFRGRDAVVANVHQTGQVRSRRGRRFVTPQRELLGVTQQELDMLTDWYLQHLDR